MRPTVTKNPWLPFGSGRDADLRLLCLPHAGAGASSYRAWGEGMSSRIAVCPVQPPGRETRRREQPETQVGPLVADLAASLAQESLTPYAIFGHSTGALSAFELCRQLRRMDAPPPVHLFVAGRRAPQIPMDQTRLRGLSVPELADVLRRLGGTPEQVLSDPGLLRMLHPLLIADFAVNETYHYVHEPPLDCPITVFAADEDPRAGLDQAAAWEHQTTGAFTWHTLRGGHFAVFQQAERVHGWIAEALLP